MKTVKTKKHEEIKATENACHLCTPLGACIVYKGIEGMVPLIHGSQGCATYMRRYMISHYREPVDIASSNFSEASTIFGGGDNLKLALKNVIQQYKPKAVGIATSCLSETIGDNAEAIAKEFCKENEGAVLPELVSVSSPSYQGDHMLGFYRAVKSTVDTLAKKSLLPKKQINVFPGFVSPADLRHLKQIFKDFNIETIMLPDYSDTLDGGSWNDYERIPAGGTTLEAIKSMGDSLASLELSWVSEKESAAKVLKDKFDVASHSLGWPLGVKQTDRFFRALENVTGTKKPLEYEKSRGRLVDSYVDGHKIVFGKKVAIYGEEDLVIAMTGFAAEIGMKPVLAAAGYSSGKFEDKLKEVLPDNFDFSELQIEDGVDFVEVSEKVKSLEADLVIGNSKGYSFTKISKTPLLRVGFPIHDRFGAQRVLHLGYEGTQNLYDKIVNLLLKQKQEATDWGYSYL